MRFLRAAVVMVLACVPVVLMSPPASALSCAYGWSDSDARKLMARSSSFFTGTVTRIDRTDRGFESVGASTVSTYDDVANLVTFEVHAVWKGTDLHRDHVVGFSQLWADELRPGKAYHVAVDGRGVSSACSFVPVAYAQRFRPAEPRLPIEAQATGAGLVHRAPTVRTSESTDGRGVVPWLIGGGVVLLAATGIVWGRRRRTSWN